jgi:hypothetical protein
VHFQRLINAAVKHLGRAPSLLRELNVILKSVQCRVVVIQDPLADSATHFVFRTSAEAFVISIGSGDSNVQVVRDSHSLRSALQSAKMDEVLQNVIEPRLPIWASVLMEILLFELVSTDVTVVRTSNEFVHRRISLPFMSGGMLTSHTGGDVCAIYGACP